jgi:hypothetical protein
VLSAVTDTLSGLIGGLDFKTELLVYKLTSANQSGSLVRWFFFVRILDQFFLRFSSGFGTEKSKLTDVICTEQK